MNSRISYIYISFNEPTYLKISHKIILGEVRKGKVVEVIDSSLTIKNQDYVNNKVSKFLRVKTVKNRFDKWIKDMNIRHIRIDIPLKAKASSYYEQIWDEIIHSNGFQEHLDSSLITFFSDTKPERNRGYQTKRVELIAECRMLFFALIPIFSEKQTSPTIYVPNGRFIDQWFFITFVNRLLEGNAEFVYFEKGFLSDTFYLGGTSLLDRVKLQKAYREIREVPETCMELAQAWFLTRFDRKLGHEFSILWNDSEKSIKEQVEGCKPYVVIFTSSEDEFAKLGQDWMPSEWDTQWEAYREVIRKFLTLEVNVVLRMHPNLLNKSVYERRDVNKIVCELKKLYPKLIVHTASSPVNSYSLILHSEMVFVWGSTIGLEAVMLGKPTVVLNASEWDQSIDVRQVLSSGHLTDLPPQLPSPDSLTALKYVAKRLSLDLPLLEEDINLFIEPTTFRYRLARNVGFRGSINLKVIAKTFLEVILRPNVFGWYRKLSLKLKETHG